MSYWGAVGRAIVVCLVLGMLWQGLLLLRALTLIRRGGASGVGFVVGGLVEFVGAVLVVGWVIGSLWYLLKKRP